MRFIYATKVYGKMGARLSSEEVADPYQIRVSKHADPLSRELRKSTLSSKNPTNTSE